MKKNFTFDAAGGTWDIFVERSGESVGGSIETHGVKCAENSELFNASIDGIESLVVALACRGFDISTYEFKNSIEDAVSACSEGYPEEE